MSFCAQIEHVSNRLSLWWILSHRIHIDTGKYLGNALIQYDFECLEDFSFYQSKSPT